MSNRRIVIVQSPDCFLHSATTFVINEFLLAGWLRRAATLGPRIKLAGEVTATLAVQLADGLARIETTPQDQLHDALNGDPGGGLKAVCDFLRGGGFELVDGATTKPEDMG